MDLPFSVIKEHIPDLRDADLLNTRSIITRFYCGKLKVNGICTKNCVKTCGSHLSSILLNLGEAKSQGALITWRAKNEAAKAVEELREEERQEPVERIPVIFDRPPVPDNPFLAFLEDLK